MEALKSSTKSRHHDRLFNLAMFKFDSAIKATPDEVHIIDQYAKMLQEIAVLKANAGKPKR